MTFSQSYSFQLRIRTRVQLESTSSLDNPPSNRRSECHTPKCPSRSVPLSLAQSEPSPLTPRMNITSPPESWSCARLLQSAPLVINSLIENHLTCNLLVFRWNWSNPFHFLTNCVETKGIAIFFVESLRLLKGLGYLHSKLVSAYSILCLELRDDPVSFVQHVLYTPTKCWLACDSPLRCPFGKLDGIRVLHIFERDPSRASILPLGLSSLRNLFAAMRSIPSMNESVLLLDFGTVRPMICDRIE
jgi:hypothetical protein